MTATGESSHATAHALFKDSGRPFWVFAHNPNSNDDATEYMQLGVNALEPDIEWNDDVGLTVRHDNGITSSNHDLVSYLQNLSVLAGQYNLALIVFDVKTDAATHPGDALELSNDIQTYLLNNHPEVHIILSTGTTSDADAFFPSLKMTQYQQLFGFQIDGENTPTQNVNHLHALLDVPGTPAKIGYGDGTAGCCGQFGGVGPFFGPNVATSLQQAVWYRTAFGITNMVTYGYATVGIGTDMMLMDSGVDGLIGSDMPLEFGSLGDGDTIDILNLVNAHYDNLYMATAADDPFSIPGAQGGVVTGSRQGYALEIQTDDSATSGTDSHLTFTLHGDLGDASTTIDSYWAGQMEDGEDNMVFVPSTDLGHLQSITVSKDDAGNAPDWNLDWIKVRSFAYIGTDYVYPTPGDPNKSQYEYFADFGGQTIDEDNAVTVTLQSGIPSLATLTNGDLVLNMGPNAAARGSGNVTDGDESFTVHYVSTQADGSEIVTVSAFGMRPQPFKGVKQIHASGGAGADTLTVDGAFGIPIFFDGGGNPGDQLVLQNALFDTVTHHFTNAHDGTVSLDPDGSGPAPAAVITYTGLAPITDTLTVAHRIFDFAGAAETITLSDDPGAVAGISRIDSTLSESVDFSNPTATMAVNASAGTGADVINVDALDPAFNADTTVNLSNGGDQVTVETTTGTTNRWTLNGGTGGDTFTVHGTAATTSVVANSASTVNVGNGGSAQGVNGTLNIENPAALNALRLDDSADTVGRTAVLSTFANAADSQANSDPWGKVHGLSPADINYEYGDTASIDVKTGTAADMVAVQATGTPTSIETGAGADVVHVSSDAPTDQGNVDGIQQALTIEAGTGANRLVVSNFGGTARTNAVITNNTITGVAPAAINYAATGGNFTDGAAGDGILVRSSDSGADTVLVLSTLAGSTTAVQGNGGADTFDVGSTPASNNGTLDGIAGKLTVIGGSPSGPAVPFSNTVDPTGQVDVLYLNDRGTAGKENYRIGDFTSDGIDNPMVTDEAAASRPARAFAGVAYDATMDYVRVDGTDDVNIFDVRPSLTTQYYIDGNLPATVGGCLVGGGDYLRLDTTGTTGRKLHITSPGSGFWSFTSGHKPVDFESIERFNHVDILATAPDAGTSSAALVKVYDAETGELLSQIAPFENSFKGGVRVATGDLNCDGLPDVIVDPGPGRDPAIKIYDGAPDASGNHPAALLASISTFPTSFKGGVNLGIGDVNGDGYNDLVLASDTGGSPSLEVLDGRFLLTSHALMSGAPTTFPANVKGGINLAVGDLNNDGYADLVAVDGAGKNTTVTVVSGNGFGVVKTFHPFSGGGSGMTPSVTVGDFDGDGHRDIILSDKGVVSVFSGSANLATWTPTLMTSFQPYGASFNGSVRLTVKPSGGGNPGTVEQVNIFTAPGPGGGNFPRIIRQASFVAYGTPPLLVDKIAADPAYNGIFIG